MEPSEITGLFTQWAHFLLMWIGFGTLVGLVAKGILPGRDPGGALATVVIGIVGSIIGAATLAYFTQGLRVTPISPVGFVMAIAGTAVLLVSNRLLGGRVFKEGLAGWRARRRRRISVVEDK